MVVSVNVKGNRRNKNEKGKRKQMLTDILNLEK